MSNASEIKSNVLDAITEYGRNMILTTVGEGTYSATTGTYSGGSEADSTFKGLLLNYKNRDVDGDRIRKDDRKCLVAASGLSVSFNLGDLVTPSANTGDPSYGSFSIQSIKIYEVQGTVFAYSLQLRNV